MAEWTEVNILPSGDPRQLLINVVDPLVHQVLDGQWNNWHYFWENYPVGKDHLRLRIRWEDPSQITADANLSAFLKGEEDKKAIDSWFRGNHGVTNQPYEGEADDYGPEVWELTYKNWTSGSELALAVLKSESEGQLTKTPQFHYERRTHLFANELLLPERMVNLYQAVAYGSPQDRTDARIGPIIEAIERLFTPPQH